MADFDPRQFLTLADSLAQRGASDQAEFRTAISRSYYAVHLQARERLTALGRMVPTGTGEDHGLVIQVLRSMGGPQGDQVDRLRVQRGRADYNLQQRFSLHHAREAVALAEALFRTLP